MNYCEMLESVEWRWECAVVGSWCNAWLDACGKQRTRINCLVVYIMDAQIDNIKDFLVLLLKVVFFLEVQIYNKCQY